MYVAKDTSTYRYIATKRATEMYISSQMMCPRDSVLNCDMMQNVGVACWSYESSQADYCKINNGYLILKREMYETLFSAEMYTVQYN